MSKKLKKLSHKYEFLKLELEETQDQADEYSKEWAKLFGKFFVDKSTEMWINTETGELRKELPTEEKIRESKPEKLKKLYRKLSVMLHPDKGGTPEDFAILKELYDEANLIELLKYAGTYDIEYEIDEADEQTIEDSCHQLGKEIEESRQTLSWLYFTGDLNKKLQVIKMLEQHLGTEIPKEDYPEELK
jgi:hypothetical protein